MNLTIISGIDPDIDLKLKRFKLPLNWVEKVL
jgi:hypothetical protein